MIEKDVILSKIATIKRCLARIKQATNLEPKSLSEIDTEDIFVLNLQRAIQASLDIAHAVISQNHYEMPNSYKMSFEVLRKNKWIDAETCTRLQKMVGFRNIAIHDYQELNSEILKSILQDHLIDFEAFYKQVHKRLV